jgi:RNA polymerase sigma factor (sigma-70 family)
VTLPPFQKLLDAHGHDVHRFLVATVGRSDADDCYQETWLAALRGYPRLTELTNPRGWVLTIAYRKAMDHLRGRKRRATPVAEPPEQPATPAAELLDDGLWALVAGLPPKQRVALTLRFVADAPYAEISGVMETSEDAARRNVYEGLKRLRTEYQP